MTTQSAHPEFWTLHVGGPDDLLYFDTEEAAEQHRDGMVDMLKALGYEQQAYGSWRSTNEFAPTINFEIIAPAGVQNGGRL